MQSYHNINRNQKSVKHKHWGTERIYYLSHFLYRRNFKRLSYALKYLNIFIFRAYIPPEVFIGERLDLPHGGFGIVMHRDTIIGDDAIIFHNVTIADGGITIGDRVYIGTGATILGPISIGDDVVIGSNTFIDFDIPSNSKVVGYKARIIV